MQLITSLLAATLLASNVAAHPGHDHRAEAAKRAAYIQKAPKRDLSHCAAKMKARGIEARAVARRAAAAQQARKKRSITGDKPYMKARDLATVLATDHESATDYTSDTAASILFASNSSCLLSPEVTQGPYWVEGEYVRNDLTDGQEGVSLILDTQVLDVNTCDPVTNAVIEIWNCNSTGVYSGIVASGNGDSSDTSNLDTTFLRGLQPTDSDGVASFSTLFPGHYTGRATHTHVIAHFNGTTFENGTYAGGYASHVGQLFYDQDLISQVELVAPYSTNTQTLTTNAEDSILSTEAASGHDPVINYSFLGDTVEEGIFGWIAFGIDLTSEQTLTPAAYLYESGGVANSNSGSSGSGGGSAPSGGPSGGPSGSAPTGFPSGISPSREDGAVPFGSVVPTSTANSCTA